MLRDFARLHTWRELRRWQNPTVEALQAEQGRRLGALVQHAYNHVEFYRQRLDRAGLRPDDIAGLADLRRLPIVGRAEMQAFAVEARTEARGPQRAYATRRTGGSTGRPLAIVTRQEDLAYETLVWLRTWKRLGLRWRDRQVTIKDPDDASPWKETQWFQHLGFLGVRYLDLHAGPEALARELEALRPDVLRAPPSILESIVRARGSASFDFHPRLIFTTSELLDENTRQLVEATLGAPVHDCYGATEAGCIAWRCPRCGSYHVNSDTVLVEVVRNGQPVAVGESGEVLITNLFSRAMPFLRYALGDLAQRGDPCPAAPAATTLRLLHGRTVSPLVAGDGTLLSPYSFMPDEIPGIDQYRIVQEGPERIRILVVPGRGFRPEALEEAQRDYESGVRHACHVVFELRNSLTLSADSSRTPDAGTKTESRRPPD